MPDDAEERKQRSLWREIIGTAIGSLPLALAVLVWGVSIETRFTKHDGKIEVLEKSDDVQVKRAEALEQKLTTRAESIEQSMARRLDRIEDKLDRAIANQSRQSLASPPQAVGPGVWRDGRPVNR